MKNDLLSDYLDSQQVQRALKCSRATILRLQRFEGLPKTKIGGRVFYRRTAIEAWLRTREQVIPTLEAMMQ